MIGYNWYNNFIESMVQNDKTVDYSQQTWDQPATGSTTGPQMPSSEFPRCNRLHGCTCEKEMTWGPGALVFPLAHGWYVYIYIYIYIWVNYNDLTATSLEIMVCKGNHPQMGLIQVGEILEFIHIYIYIYVMFLVNHP